MASDVRRRTHEILSQVVPVLFADPSKLHDEAILMTRLFRPLESAWRAREISNCLEQHETVSNFCGKVFKSGEPCVFCRYGA